jgi:septal ring factor EnvC (AmiA/AmiB activator)
VLRALALLVVLGPAAVAAGAAVEGQLDSVRSRIRELEHRLTVIERRSADATARRERMTAELELAEHRVAELEMVLTATRDEAVRLKQEAAELAGELQRRRKVLARHLEMMALLGQPGPLQLLYDAARGGNLEEAMGTVSVLTAGQVQLMREYDELQVERSVRLADLSRVLSEAGREAAQLIARREELGEVRARVEQEIGKLQRRQETTVNRLQEMRQREAALEQLMELVGSRERLTGSEDVRRYRGALPWPARGEIVQGFGRHYLPKYATYTVCNGIRLNVDSGTEVTAVFPGVVAYARHFKGYGNMVVVDHGHEVYSLVAGLSSIHVRLDQQVAMGTRLGVAPPPTDEGNLYLEIRVANRPQDPRRWLQLEEGRS